MHYKQIGSTPIVAQPVYLHARRRLSERVRRWRDRTVRITRTSKGDKVALIDIKTGQKLHDYGGRTQAYLPGHKDAFLEDFAAERIPTDKMGVYKWRDR